MSKGRRNPEARDILNTCVGELYRHRLGVREQGGRLKAATEVLRAQRKETEERAFELLFSPEWTEEWFREQYEVLRREDIPEMWRVKTEAQYLLVSVRGIYMMSRAVAQVAGPGTRATVAKAIAAFEEEVPDAMLLRNIHEHLEEYIAERGHHQQQLPSPFEESGVGMLDEGLAYFLGGKLFLLWEVSAAAERLAREVAEGNKGSHMNSDWVSDERVKTVGTRTTTLRSGCKRPWETQEDRCPGG